MDTGISIQREKTDDATLRRAKQESTSSFSEQRPSFPLTREQAAITAYPPGCPVLHVDESETPPVVTVGEVDSVSFDVSSKDLLFRVTPNDAYTTAVAPIVASESQLLFAPLCTVEATIRGISESTTKPAIVLTSYQPRPASEALYSLQEEESGSLLHGLPKTCIKYRPVDSGEQNRRGASNYEVTQAMAATEVPTNLAQLPKDPPREESLPPVPVAARAGRRPSAPGYGIKRAIKESTSRTEAENVSANDMNQQLSKRAKLSFLIDSSEESSTPVYGHSSAGNADDAERRNGESLSQEYSVMGSLHATQDCRPVNSIERASYEQTDGKTRQIEQLGEEEKKGEGDLYETSFDIPGNVFHVDTIEGTLGEGASRCVAWPVFFLLTLTLL